MDAKKEVTGKGVQFQAKKNCKTCHGRGFIIRTFPIGTVRSGRKKDDKKESHGIKTLCHCATEIPKEEVEPVLKVNIPSPEECFVPKVVGDTGVMAVNPYSKPIKKVTRCMPKSKQYASRAVPNG